MSGKLHRNVADNLQVIPETEGLAERDFDRYSEAIKRDAISFMTSTAGTASGIVITVPSRVPKYQPAPVTPEKKRPWYRRLMQD